MVLLFALSFSMVIIITSVFFRFPIFIPTPWVTAILYIYIAPVFLYSLSAFVRPSLVIAICIPSLAIAEILWSVVYGSAGELMVNVILSVNTWGVGCLLISFLRKRNEILAMITGSIWSFFGVIIPASIYYGLVLNWSILYMVAFSLFTMLFNIALVPVALILNYLLRQNSRFRELEKILSG